MENYTKHCECLKFLRPDIDLVFGAEFIVFLNAVIIIFFVPVQIMCSISLFPAPPPPGEITYGELESKLISGPSHSITRCFKDHIARYPNVDISCDLLRPSISRKNARSAFIETTDTAFKRTVIAWHEHGVLGVLEELSKNDEVDGNVCQWIGKVANCMLTVYNWLQSFHLKIFPHLRLPSEDLISVYSEANDWKHGIIRALAWHPQTLKCAIALQDDSIRIFASNNNMVPILKHRLQKEVTSMAWKPYCSSMLAVACHNGVLVWQIDPTSLVTRPSSSCVTFLSQKGPVTNVLWHPHDCLLASSSAVDTTMHVWDVSMETDVPLQRMGGGGVSFLRWSPDGMRLFAATPSPLFRIWETQTWTCERWSNLIGHCQAACWSPDGSMLLFASLDEPVIYYLSFTLPNEMAFYQVGGSKSAIPIVDLTQILIDTGFDETQVGGRVQNMVWDKTGERLAVSFKDSNELIAVFRTKLKPTFEIRPLGFIRGLPSESVQIISFHDGFQYGALLTVCWSSGRVSHIPFLFISVGGEMNRKIPFYKRDLTPMTETGPTERTIFSTTISAE